MSQSIFPCLPGHWGQQNVLGTACLSDDVTGGGHYTALWEEGRKRDESTENSLTTDRGYRPKTEILYHQP